MSHLGIALVETSRPPSWLITLETDTRVKFRIRVRVQWGRKKRVWIRLGFLGFRVADTGHVVRTGGWDRCGEGLGFPPNQVRLLQLTLGV